MTTGNKNLELETQQGTLSHDGFALGLYLYFCIKDVYHCIVIKKWMAAVLYRQVFAFEPN